MVKEFGHRCDEDCRACLRAAAPDRGESLNIVLRWYNNEQHQLLLLLSQYFGAAQPQNPGDGPLVGILIDVSWQPTQGYWPIASFNQHHQPQTNVRIWKLLSIQADTFPKLAHALYTHRNHVSNIRLDYRHANRGTGMATAHELESLMRPLIVFLRDIPSAQVDGPHEGTAQAIQTCFQAKIRFHSDIQTVPAILTWFDSILDLVIEAKVHSPEYGRTVSVTAALIMNSPEFEGIIRNHDNAPVRRNRVWIHMYHVSMIALDYLACSGTVGTLDNQQSFDNAAAAWETIGRGPFKYVGMDMADAHALRACMRWRLNQEHMRVFGADRTTLVADTIRDIYHGRNTRLRLHTAQCTSRQQGDGCPPIYQMAEDDLRQRPGVQIDAYANENVLCEDEAGNKWEGSNNVLNRWGGMDRVKKFLKNVSKNGHNTDSMNRLHVQSNWMVQGLENEKQLSQ